MPSPIPQNDSKRSDARSWVLRPTEQQAIAVLLLASTALIIGYITFLNVRYESVIDIEKIEYRPAHFAIDINHATWPEMANIPGVGRNLAETIVEYRSTVGKFASIDELDRVPGIGQATLEILRPYVLPITSSSSSPVVSQQSQINPQ